MSFTVKDIFPALNLSQDELNKHRMAVGTGVRDSWIDLHKSPPPKIEEEGHMVCSYHDEFRLRAEAVIARYIAKTFATPKKRPRRRVTGYEKI